MKHLGDITKIDGAEIEPVDVVTGGSPCQDLSIAGRRSGLAGARSGLFMEQIRIVKEMRKADERNRRTDESMRPRYMVWENVAGAFSSNGGRDFAKVLEEIIRIIEPEAPDIEVPKKGWPAWGGYHDAVGGRWSVAWRVHDAQYWGVPQRRRRIAVVADFGGDSAGEILFERKSVPRHPAPCREAGKRPAGESETGSSYAVRIRGGGDGGGKGALVQTEKSGTLGTGNDQTIFCLATQQGGAELRSDDLAPTLTAAAGMSGNNQPVVVRTAGNQVPLTYAKQALGIYKASDKASTCSARDYKDSTDLICAVDCRNFTENSINGTLQAKESGGSSLNLNNVVRTQLIVRRLTPLECERLQGFPDGWTDIGKWRDSKGKLHKPANTPKYKALGNSIALPFWDFLAKRISAQYLRPITMGSLFDGIGGFPLVFERHNGEGTALWASEIEEFPIAVTKRHFKEDSIDA